VGAYTTHETLAGEEEGLGLVTALHPSPASSIRALIFGPSGLVGLFLKKFLDLPLLVQHIAIV